MSGGGWRWGLVPRALVPPSEGPPSQGHQAEPHNTRETLSWVNRHLWSHGHAGTGDRKG